MKKISTILTLAIFVFFFNSQVGLATESAESYEAIEFMTEAIEYAEIAKQHKAHADHVVENAKESLEYVKKAEIAAIEQGNNKGREHITEAIQHLYEAINHGKQGHTRIANEHLTDAIIEMQQFISE